MDHAIEPPGTAERVVENVEAICSRHTHHPLAALSCCTDASKTALYFSKRALYPAVFAAQNSPVVHHLYAALSFDEEWYIYTYIIFMYIYRFVCIYIHIFMYICTFVYIYTYKYIDLMSAHSSLLPSKQWCMCRQQIYMYLHINMHRIRTHIEIYRLVAGTYITSATNVYIHMWIHLLCISICECI